MTVPVKCATLDDLYKVEGKAELINGRIVEIMVGGTANEVATNVLESLRAYMRRHPGTRAYSDGMGFTVPQLPSGRQSFSPDAAFHTGPFPADRDDFVEGG